MERHSPDFEYNLYDEIEKMMTFLGTRSVEEATRLDKGEFGLRHAALREATAELFSFLAEMYWVQVSFVDERGASVYVDDFTIEAGSAGDGSLGARIEIEAFDASEALESLEEQDPDDVDDDDDSGAAVLRDMFRKFESDMDSISELAEQSLRAQHDAGFLADLGTLAFLNAFHSETQGDRISALRSERSGDAFRIVERILAAGLLRVTTASGKSPRPKEIKSYGMAGDGVTELLT